MDHLDASRDGLVASGVCYPRCEGPLGLRDCEHHLGFPLTDSIGDRDISTSREDQTQRSRSALEWILASLDPINASVWTDRLLDRFGSIGTIFSEKPVRISQALGGDVRPALHLARYRSVMVHIAQSELSNTPVLDSWDQLMAYLRLEMGHLRLEQMRALFLDSGYRLIADDMLATGSINEVQLYPRQIAKRAVLHDAAGVILVHNHPSGNPKMSPADRSMTYAADEACRAVGVRLHDHLVICRDAYSSFRQDNPLWARS